MGRACTPLSSWPAGCCADSGRERGADRQLAVVADGAAEVRT